MPNRILILTALCLEAQALARALTLPRGPGVDEWLSEALALHVIGMHAIRMPPSDAAQGPPRGIVLAGLAGALDPALRVGDVVLDADSRPMPQSKTLRVGRIHGAVAMVLTPQAKQELHAQTAALAVDMESAPVRHWLAEHAWADRPFLHLRAISDAAEDAIDPAVANLVDAFGAAKPGALAGLLLRRPGSIGTLRRLQKNADLAAARLGQTLRDILAQGWPTAPPR